MTNEYMFDKREGNIREYTYHATQRENEWRALKGWGLLKGLVCTAAGVDMDVDYTAGVTDINGTIGAPGASAVTIGASDGTKARLDIILINKAGTVSTRAGNLETSSGANDYYPPDLNADEGLLYYVHVQAGATTIATADLTSKRIFVQPSTFQEVTGSRALDTTYTNDTEVTRKVMITLDLTSGGGNGYFAEAILNTDGSTPPTTTFAKAYTEAVYTGGAVYNPTHIRVQLVCEVKPGENYRLDDNDNNGTSSILEWYETG